MKIEKRVKRARDKLMDIHKDYIDNFFEINGKIDKTLEKKDNQKARETLREIYIKYGEELIELGRKIDKYLETIQEANNDN